MGEEGGGEAGGWRKAIDKVRGEGGCPPFPAEQSLSIVNMHAGVGGWSTKYRNQPKIPQAHVAFCSRRINVTLRMHYLNMMPKRQQLTAVLRYVSQAWGLSVLVVQVSKRRT